MKFKVGDRVRVRDDLHVAKGYDDPPVVEDMLKYKGQELTITKIRPIAYALSNNDYCWTDEMLEPVNPTLADIKENKPMKMKFRTTEGYRIDKSNNTKIETITTHVTIINNSILLGKATCDKADYNEREGVLNAIANAVCNENFDREYNRAVKQKKNEYKKSCTCMNCHKVFDTPEEARAHEKWHIENKKARRQRYLERCEAKKRMAEIERENRIKAYMDDLAKDKK